ncbi:MAG: polysaccharide biosynthesis/export family protein [Candidatus Omnitrophica bacterium]|nr:polysaccharide biosynthesis/export family protein [Candidatus Omnitrophota bacterium]
MKKIFFLILIVFIALATYSNLVFAQDSQTAKELATEGLLKERISALYEKAVSFYNQDKLKEADELLINILKVDPLHEGASLYLYEKIPDRIASRKAQEKDLKIQEELARKRPTKENIDALYKKTVTLYKKNDLNRAKEFFGKVLELDPNHKGAKLYLDKKIPDRIEAEKQQEKDRLKNANKEKVDSLYKKAKVFYDNGQLDRASDMCYQIFELDPDHKGAKVYLREKIPNKIELAKQIEERKATESEQEAETEREKALKEKIKSLYKQGVSSYNKDELGSAKYFFGQVLELDPDNSNAKKYLQEKIPDKIELSALEAKYRLELQKEEEISERARQEQFVKEEARIEETTRIYKEQIAEGKVQTINVQESVEDIPIDIPIGDEKDLTEIENEASQEQFIKQEAIVEEKTKIYQEQIANSEVSVQEVQEEEKKPIENKPVAVNSAIEEEIPIDKYASVDSSQYEYLVSTGDSLEISLYGEPDMKQVTKVSEEGLITYPFLGSIKVKDLNAREIEEKIAGLLGEEYFVDPQVTVVIKVHAKFNILGEVRRPGSYEISGPTTVIDAISVAGGFTDIANKNGVKVVRKDGDRNKVIKVPVHRILKTGDSSKNIYLKKGDTIVVPESFF